MIQELITYMILGAAIAMAVSMFVKKFKRKKPQVKKVVDYKNETFKYEHNCSECSAECVLRDAVKPVSKGNVELCAKIETQKKL